MEGPWNCHKISEEITIREGSGGFCERCRRRKENACQRTSPITEINTSRKWQCNVIHYIFMIYLKRTFHPVGQGAFFTEQFYDDAMEHVLYNVVYDCGSKSPGIRIQMERDIRNSFYDKKTIDVLFLSHFDDDHVNYVKYLKNHGCLEGTRIFIPMIEAEEWLGIRPY